MTFLLKWAEAIDKIIKPTARTCNFMAVSMLGVMVILVVTHVFGRFLFNAPLSGLPELEGYSLVVLAFLGLAYAGVVKAHVRVDIIVNKFPIWLQHVIDTCTGLTSLTLWVFIAWRSFEYALKVMDPMVGSAWLEIPIFPFIFLIVFGSVLFWFVLISDILRSIHGAVNEGKLKALWIPFGLVVIAGISLVALLVELPMSTYVVGLLGIGLLIIFLFLRMPIAFAMGFVGLLGVWYFRSWEASAMVVGTLPYYTSSWFVLAVVPLFVLMGQFCFHAEISKEIFNSAYAWLGRLPGGIASATIGGCAGFAAICGDSLSTAATMGTVSLPEFKRFKYDDSLATGVLAAGGTLGILIPPSMGFIYYSLITEQSAGQLFIAGIVPGICLASLFILVTTIRTILNPKLGPPGPTTTWAKKFKSLAGTWPMFALFFMVVGGIYMGVFTVIEAGGVGSLGALLILLIKKRFTFKKLTNALLDTGRIAAMLIIIFVGVFIMGVFMTSSDVPLQTAEFISDLQLNRYIILALILLVYVILGMLMNIVPMIMLTLPIFYPMIVFMGFDLIWFGVVMVIMMEMGQITPPIGINVFVIAGVAKTVPMGAIFKGIMPFWAIEIVFLVILTAFPQIALWLPSMMWGD